MLRYLAGMTVDATSRRMPVGVLVSALLLGLAGLAGAGVIAYGATRFGDGGEPLAIGGTAWMLVCWMTAAGMTLGKRFAQIIGMAIGLLAAFGGIAQLMQGSPAGVLWLAVAAGITLPVGLPMSSRMWFTEQVQATTGTGTSHAG